MINKPTVYWIVTPEKKISHAAMEAILKQRSIDTEGLISNDGIGDATPEDMLEYVARKEGKPFVTCYDAPPPAALYEVANVQVIPTTTTEV